MALPTWQDLKVLLRVQTTAEDGAPTDTPPGTGNGLLARLLERARAEVEAYLQRPIIAEPQTATDRADSLKVWGVIDELLFPMSPIAPTPAPVILDTDGLTVDPATYDVDYLGGRFLARRGVSFDNGPYTITATAGLSAHPRYAQMEPIVAAAILDVAVDRYVRREAALLHESAGGGVSRSYDPKTGLPLRVVESLARLRRLGWA